MRSATWWCSEKSCYAEYARGSIVYLRMCMAATSTIRQDGCTSTRKAAGEQRAQKGYRVDAQLPKADSCWLVTGRCRGHCTRRRILRCPGNDASEEQRWGSGRIFASANMVGRGRGADAGRCVRRSSGRSWAICHQPPQRHELLAPSGVRSRFFHYALACAHVVNDSDFLPSISRALSSFLC
ncbi:hypothetical protein OH77DRAFT_463394 [Trametes cingulata]|nr:hypothetical protein OH77DRAFT_463394 [Trametes cingulata]